MILEVPIATRRRGTRQTRRARERNRRRPRLRDVVPLPVQRWIFRSVLAALAITALLLAWAYRPIPIPKPPPEFKRTSGYRIVYRVDDTAGPERIVSTETVDIRRPFDSNSATLKDAPPGSKIQFATVTNRMFFYNLGENGTETYGVKRPPGGGHRDASWRAIEHAIKLGLTTRLGTGTVLGHRCTRILHKDPYPEALSLPTNKKERVITCVSRDGVMLQENWWLSGRIVRVRKAVELIETAPAPDRFFEGRTPAQSKAAELIAKDQTVEDNKINAEHPAIPRKVPPGFEKDRAASVTDSGGEQGPARFTYQESYRRGTELVTIVQGETPSGKAPWDPAQGQKVLVGSLGDARAVTFLDRVEVRIAAGTNYIRIAAPSYELALYFARTLQVR